MQVCKVPQVQNLSLRAGHCAQGSRSMIRAMGEMSLRDSITIFGGWVYWDKKSRGMWSGMIHSSLHRHYSVVKHYPQ